MSNIYQRLDSFDSRRVLQVGTKSYHYHSLKSEKLLEHADIDRLPFSIKVLLEGLLRNEDGLSCDASDIIALANSAKKKNEAEITYNPTRVLMQDFTGVPAIVDLAAMRHALVDASVDPDKINPLSPVHLVIDHSLVINQFAHHDAFSENVALEMERNKERYSFLKWGQKSFSNFHLVPPGTGICHQVNLEFLSKGVWSHKDKNGDMWAYPDTLVGTDSHTTMVNALGVLGWGVGGIEAEAAMLGQPISMRIPEVVGFCMEGQLNEGITATDLVLHIVEILRNEGVVGKFVEFYGSALSHLSLADRATISNMAPEYGATCGFFPIDDEVIRYMRLSGRDEETLELVEHYCRAQGLWYDSTKENPIFTKEISLDLSSVEPCLAGPKRPQDRVKLPDVSNNMSEFIKAQTNLETNGDISNRNHYKQLQHGDVVIASITSCTNTSNPAVMIGAGLLAKKAVAKGLSSKPWVKTSLAPGSQVVSEYLEKSNLQGYFDTLGFHVVGYGCTTCIGNSGPLLAEIEQKINDEKLLVASVLSGNRNFEGRIHPLVKANWLASPPLVVAYALAGTTLIDLQKDPLGEDSDGKPIFLKDIWPSNLEIHEELQKIDRSMFQKKYADVYEGDTQWQSIATSAEKTYSFSDSSTYIQLPPYFEKKYSRSQTSDITGAKILAVLGDSITTDHISPAGSIATGSPAAKYLEQHGVSPQDFNSYGSRRGNHEVMMRGTFANIRIRNEMLTNQEGGLTLVDDQIEPLSIYDAAMHYIKNKQPVVVIAGKEYGTGSSRDWAAKGTKLLGVKAVIVESFERIHRSNLVGMGVLPLQFMGKDNRKTLKISGRERIDILGLNQPLSPRQVFTGRIRYQNGSSKTFTLLSRLDTKIDLEYYKSGGVLNYVLNKLIDNS